MPRRAELDEVRSHLGHVKEQLERVREELKSSHDEHAPLERKQLDEALAETVEADRELNAIEEREDAEAAARVYHADPGARTMAVFFLILMGGWTLALFLTRWIG